VKLEGYSPNSFGSAERTQLIVLIHASLKTEDPSLQQSDISVTSVAASTAQEFARSLETGPGYFIRITYEVSAPDEETLERRRTAVSGFTTALRDRANNSDNTQAFVDAGLTSTLNVRAETVGGGGSSSAALGAGALSGIVAACAAAIAAAGVGVYYGLKSNKNVGSRKVKVDLQTKRV
jgi:hypothetical protein